MLARIGSVIAGFALNAVIMVTIEGISKKINPPPPNFDFNDKKQVEEFVKNMTISGKFLVLLAEAAGVFCGSTLASYLSGQAHSGIIIGALTTLGCVANLRAVPGHSALFSTVYLGLSLPISYYGGNLGISLIKP